MLGNLATQVAPKDSEGPRRERLRQIIEEKSFRFGETFTLASGRTSNIFFNLKQTMMDPEGANLLADAILEVMEREGIRNVGGLEMGAVPLVVAVCTKSFGRFQANHFFVRKETKTHGARQLIDGHIAEGEETLILEDVITTGGSVLKAVAAARARGCRVSKVLTVVDRLEGGRENLEKEGLELMALYDRHDFPTEV